MAVPFLEIKNISKSFPGVKALDNVSLKMDRGEIHALLGENGAGKSTLMNILAGLLVPDSGIMLKDGKELPVGDPVATLQNGIGMVPQELTLVPHLSVAENIFLGTLPKRYGKLHIDWKEAARRAEKVLEPIDPTINPRHKLADLSMAQQQLVQIARATAFNADILIFDEPTSALTYRETDKLFDLIDRFREGGGSVFYISHRMEEIKRLCQVLTILRDGCHVKTDRVDTLETQEIINLMVGRESTPVERTIPENVSGGRTVLRVKNLTRAGEFSEASFELRQGEILGFAGLVGAGRTELMKCIAGDTKPDSGSVVVGEDSEACRFGHPCEAIARGIAYLPEERRNYGIFPVMNVSENMTIANLRGFTGALGIDKRREVKAVDEMIRELRIKTPSWRQAIRNLSGGNQQKVILARWLLRGSEIMILDEPTRGIDVKAKREIHDLLWRIRERGDVSVIMVSSELQELLDACDRIVVMHEGHIKGEIVPDKNTTQADVMRLALT